MIGHKTGYYVLSNEYYSTTVTTIALDSYDHVVFLLHDILDIPPGKKGSKIGIILDTYRLCFTVMCTYRHHGLSTFQSGFIRFFVHSLSVHALEPSSKEITIRFHRQQQQQQNRSNRNEYTLRQINAKESSRRRCIAIIWREAFLFNVI